MVKYCVDLRNKQTGNTDKVIFETFDHSLAWRIAEKYNAENPNSNYFADVYNDEV